MLCGVYEWHWMQGNKQKQTHKYTSSAIVGKTGKTSVFPWFSKIECGGDSGDMLQYYSDLSLPGRSHTMSFGDLSTKYNHFTFRAYLITILNVLAYTFVLLRHIEKLCVQHSLAHEMCNDRRSVFELQSFCSAFSCANSCKNVRQNFLFHYQPSDNNFGGAATKAAWTR